MIIQKPTSTKPLSIMRHSQVVYLTILILFFIGLLLLMGSPQTNIVMTPKEAFFNEPAAISLNSSGLLPVAIHYTLDGSEPTTASSRYEEPISIEKTTTIRAAAFRNNQQVGKINTFPVFIQTNHEIAVINIATNPENLWDEERGIYVNFEEEGDEWERPAQLSFYEPDGRLGFQKDIGLRIHGGGSTGLPQKSFRIYAGYLNHSDQINYPIFPELDYTKFNTFLLRTGATDWQHGYIRDALLHTLASDLTDIDTQAVRPAVVYLNGEYWGVYFLRERIDQHYLANKYGISKNRVSIIEIPHDVGVDRGKTRLDYGNNKAVDDYNTLFEAAQHCSSCAHYSEFSVNFDITNFIDYMIFEFYSGNFDWPFGNVKLWRYERPARATPEELSSIDGRFRWIFYDLDVGLAHQKKTVEDVIKSSQNDLYNRLSDNKFPFMNLFFDSKVKQEYLTRTAELFNDQFSPEYVMTVIDQLAASIRPEMPAQVARWRDEQAEQVFPTQEEWEQQIEFLKVYAQHRHQAVFEDTADFYDLPGLSYITLKSEPPEGGAVSIGAIHKLSEELPWQGTFFTNSYMAIEAHPARDYVFDHWEGEVLERRKKDKRVVLRIDNQEEFKAVFRKKQWFEYLNLGIF